ncbi:hypothetical protein J6590_086295 [Homalodisca vitripennis]|nr:hypothetical protein J6590_086295 [Homalodisca vitripennis]
MLSGQLGHISLYGRFIYVQFGHCRYLQSNTTDFLRRIWYCWWLVILGTAVKHDRFSTSNLDTASAVKHGRFSTSNLDTASAGHLGTAVKHGRFSTSNLDTASGWSSWAQQSNTADFLRRIWTLLMTDRQKPRKSFQGNGNVVRFYDSHRGLTPGQIVMTVDKSSLYASRSWQKIKENKESVFRPNPRNDRRNLQSYKARLAIRFKQTKW